MVPSTTYMVARKKVRVALNKRKESPPAYLCLPVLDEAAPSGWGMVESVWAERAVAGGPPAVTPAWAAVAGALSSRKPMG